MGQQQRIGVKHTVVFTDDDGFTKVVYHQTPVVKFNHKKIILNTGGYKTVTTKSRMNQTSNQFKLGFSVYQKDFEWFVTYGSEPIPFNARILELDRTA